VTIKHALNTDWLNAPQVSRIFSVLGAGNVRLVGGCVRDGLLGLPVSDIDFATRHAPEETMRLAEAGGLKVVPTGLSHGTVTLIHDGIACEVTTLRKDVETDGRHAKVAFTRAWEADAARRDFTINALYADADGTLYDYFSGREDLAAGHVRFIGDPQTRIKEDALRILRFYRFSARFADTLDSDGRQACKHRAGAIKSLSRERVHSEWFKLLGATDPRSALAAIAEDDVLAAFLPEAQMSGFGSVLAQENTFHLPISGLRRFAALLPAHAKDVERIARRLKCSNTQREALVARAQRLDPSLDPKVVVYTYGAELSIDLALLSGWADGQLKALVETAQHWTIPQFPLRGRDLLEKTQLRGADIGRALHLLEQRWVDSGFTLSAEALVDHAIEI